MALKKSKSIVALAISSFLLFAACDGDSSSSPVSPSDNEESSSSVTLSSSSSDISVIEASSSSIDSAKSSSSVKKESSSSVATANSSSSTVEASSSSIDSAKSSSSDKKESSSSVTQSSSSSDISVIEESSSSIALENSSSSLMSSSSVIPSSSGESSSSIGGVFESSFNPDIIYGTMTDSRDKKVYKTVRIGAQTWMAENLNYADSATTPSLLERSWCYKNDSANCAVAGRLYTWAAAIDSVKLATDADNPQDCGYRKTCTLPDTVYGICPPGWHLPTRTEWKTLLTEVGGLSTASKILKSQTGWYNNGNGTDGVGFSALPAGGWDVSNGEFFAGGRLANFWSASGDDSHSAYHMDLSYEDDHANLTGYYKNYGYSVRCLQN